MDTPLVWIIDKQNSTRPYISQSMSFFILKLCQYYEILSLAQFVPKVYLQFPTVRRLTKYSANSKNVRICHLHLRMLHFLKLNKLFYDALINSLWYSKMNFTSYLSSTQTMLRDIHYCVAASSQVCRQIH